MSHIDGKRVFSPLHQLSSLKTLVILAFFCVGISGKEVLLNWVNSSQSILPFCELGVDGPSQMALEDIAMFRSIPNCVVFYPSDAVSCERAVELAANYKDMTFIRATRGETPVVYANDEKFEIGKAKVREKMSL